MRHKKQRPRSGGRHSQSGNAAVKPRAQFTTEFAPFIKCRVPAGYVEMTMHLFKPAVQS